MSSTYIDHQEKIIDDVKLRQFKIANDHKLEKLPTPYFIYQAQTNRFNL